MNNNSNIHNSKEKNGRTYFLSMIFLSFLGAYSTLYFLWGESVMDSSFLYNHPQQEVQEVIVAQNAGQEDEEKQKKQFLQLLKERQDCSKIHKENKYENTVSCPCGHFTGLDYHKNMVELYGDSIKKNPAMLTRCLQSSLPFDFTDPLECWPRLFVLASYPTSGNELARTITSLALKRDMFVSEYGEGVSAPYFMIKLSSRENERPRVLSSQCKGEHKSFPTTTSSLPIPMMRKSALWKTHWPKGTVIGMEPMFEPSQNNKLGGLHFDGIIRLARNPGDHVLRDKSRSWGRSKPKSCDDQCFKEKALRKCPLVVQGAHDWTNWHKYWIEIFKHDSIPYHIYHYEHFSFLKHAVKATQKLVAFMNETTSITNKELESVIREPSYVHGTLLADICGKEIAREVHEVTKDVAVSVLGYTFDYESATWALAEPEL